MDGLFHLNYGFVQTEQMHPAGTVIMEGQSIAVIESRLNLNDYPPAYFTSHQPKKKKNVNSVV